MIIDLIRNKPKVGEQEGANKKELVKFDRVME